MRSRNSIAYFLLLVCIIPIGFAAESFDLEWFQGSWEADIPTSEAMNPLLAKSKWELKDGQFFHFNVKDGVVQAKRKGKSGTTTFSYAPLGSDSAILYLASGKTATVRRVDTGFCLKPDIPPEFQVKHGVSTLWFCFSKHKPLNSVLGD